MTSTGEREGTYKTISPSRNPPNIDCVPESQEAPLASLVLPTIMTMKRMSQHVVFTSWKVK